MTRLIECLVSLVGYGFAAVVLSGSAIDGFDRVADRPRRPPGFSVELAEALEAVPATSPSPSRSRPNPDHRARPGASHLGGPSSCRESHPPGRSGRIRTSGRSRSASTPSAAL